MNNNINSLANAVAKLSDSDYAAFWDNLLKRRVSAPATPGVSVENINKFVNVLKDLVKEQSFSSEATVSFNIKVTENSYFDVDQVMIDSAKVEITHLDTDLIVDKKQLQETLTYALEDHYGGSSRFAKTSKYLETTNEKIQNVLDEIYNLEDTTGEEILEPVMEKLSNRKVRMRRSLLGVKRRRKF